jgi:hypothetical protein
MSSRNIIRLLGVFAIVVFLPYESPPPNHGSPADWLSSNALILFGVLPLVAFLWLAVSGTFGYGSPRREDWPALVAFALALGIREGYARQGIAELELYFFYGAYPMRHSIIHPLLQMFLQRLFTDPYVVIPHVNGVLGSLAVLPLYLFVRQRTQSQMMAFLVATFFAVHPILVQMSPTDGPYALLTFTWFLGLVLLTADDIRGAQLFGSAGLLGIAATCRAEGLLFPLASLLLIDVRALLAAAGRHLGAATVSACLLLGLVTVHMYYCLGAHVPAGETLPSFGDLSAWDILRAGLFSLDFNHPVFVALVALGMLAGLVDQRMRLGLGAALASVLVAWPISPMQTTAFMVIHRMVPVCSLQAIAAGVGAAWITGWLTSRGVKPVVAAIPALGLALSVFAEDRHTIRNPNAVTDEFWMLRNHLAPDGAVKTGCTLLSVGRPMDTDICDFAQVVPGMKTMRCEFEDCARLVSDGGCFYYLRSLNCFHAEAGLPAQCLARGRTPEGDLVPCMDPRCVELERALALEAVEERTVDFRNVFHGLPHSWPDFADIGLYRVIGAR